MKKLLAIAGLIGISAIAAAPALADTDFQDFLVTANVIASCKFTTSAPVAFGSLTVPMALEEKSWPGAGSVTILCTKDTATSIALDLGKNDGGSGARKMKITASGGTATLGYTLYQDTDRLITFGSGPDAKTDYVGTGLRDAINIYGLLPWSEAQLKDSPVGSYEDTVRATVTF